MRQEYRRLPFASSKQTSEELSVQVELLQESAEVSIVLQHVQHGKMFPVTMLYVGNLLPEEGNKWFNLDKSYGFVREQQFALHESLIEITIYQKLCHVAMKLTKAVEGNAKSETQVMISPFRKKSDFQFNVSLVEEAIPSDSTVWNHWTCIGNSGMDAVAQAKGIDETQLSNVHRKRPKKRTWKIEPTSNLQHEMDHKMTHFGYVSSETTHQWQERIFVPLKYHKQQVVAMGRLQRSSQYGLRMSRLVNCKCLMIVWSLIETQMIRSWSFLMKDALWRYTNRSGRESPQHSVYWAKTRK